MYVLLLAAALTTQPRKKERREYVEIFLDTGSAFDKLLKEISFKILNIID